VHFADFDGDGRPDGVDGAGTVYQSRRARPSAMPAPVDGSASGAAGIRGDFNGDGRPDFATYNVSTGAWSVALTSVASGPTCSPRRRQR